MPLSAAGSRTWSTTEQRRRLRTLAERPTRSVPHHGLLGTSQQAEAALQRQEELGDEEIGIARNEHRDDAETETLLTWLGELGTERLVEQRVRVRLGQHRFAAAVLAAYDRRCGFAVSPPRVSGSPPMPGPKNDSAARTTLYTCHEIASAIVVSSSSPE